MPHLIRRNQNGRRPRSRRRRVSQVLLAALLVAAVAYGSFALIVRSSRTLFPGNGVHLPASIASLPGLSPPEEPAGRINILILGIDHRPGEGDEYLPHAPGQPDDPGRSDTMAVVSVDTATKTASILSIPRDLWIEVQDGHGGWTIDRINEAYHTGEVDRLPGGGGAAAAAAVTHDFGIPIAHYVALDFAGFTALVDALGGIDLDVPGELTATVLPRMDTGGYEYTFFAGQQHLSGELALAYSRFRLDADGDFGRIKRQQAVVLAARQRAFSLGWIDRPLGVWDKYKSAILTDIPSYKLPGYALLGKQIEGRGITARSLGETGATREMIVPGTGAAVLLPNPDAIAQIVSEAFADPSLGATTLARLRQMFPAPGVAPAGINPARVGGSGHQAAAAPVNPGPAGLGAPAPPPLRPAAPPPPPGLPAAGPPAPFPTTRAVVPGAAQTFPGPPAATETAIATVPTQVPSSAPPRATLVPTGSAATGQPAAATQTTAPVSVGTPGAQTAAPAGGNPSPPTAVGTRSTR